MRDSEEIYMAAKLYVAEYENYRKMDDWLKCHTNEEAKPLEGRINQIIRNTGNALNNLVNACSIGV